MTFNQQKQDMQQTCFRHQDMVYLLREDTLGAKLNPSTKHIEFSWVQSVDYDVDPTWTVTVTEENSICGHTAQSSFTKSFTHSGWEYDNLDPENRRKSVVIRVFRPVYLTLTTTAPLRMSVRTFGEIIKT